MNAPQKLHDAGQSLWLDNIHRELLTSGTLKRYIKDLAVTGLTSNPSIFEHAIAGTSDYDDALMEHTGKGLDPEKVFFEIALEDIPAAADVFELFLRLSVQGKTIIMVTHNTELASRVPRLIEVSDGRIARDEPTGTTVEPA